MWIPFPTLLHETELSSLRETLRFYVRLVPYGVITEVVNSMGISRPYLTKLYTRSIPIRGNYKQRALIIELIMVCYQHAKKDFNFSSE